MVYCIDPSELIDITEPLSGGTPPWPGDTPFERSVREGHGFRTSRISMSSHSGSHMDAPSHLTDYRGTIDMVPHERMLLPAQVVLAPGSGMVDGPDLDGLELNGRALLVRSIGDSDMTAGERNGHLSAGAARMAVDRGVAVAGTDSMSIDPPDSDETHRVLLGGSVYILENLRLTSVRPGSYILLCFPLRIESGDGSPVRAFLHPF